MPLIFYYNEVGTEVLVINDLLIYCRPQFTPEREVRGSKPTAAVLCP